MADAHYPQNYIFLVPRANHDERWSVLTEVLQYILLSYSVFEYLVVFVLSEFQKSLISLVTMLGTYYSSAAYVI